MKHIDISNFLRPFFLEQIYLPHGGEIDVVYYRSIGWSTMNIQIYPSTSDIGQLEGLCGDYNGRLDDDLLHSDGSRTTVNVDYYRDTNPDAFSASWGYAFLVYRGALFI